MKRMMRSLCLSVGLLFSSGALAETVSLSPAVLQQLNRAQQAMTEENYVKAAEVLQKLSQQKLSKPAEAYTLQFRGNLALIRQQEKTALGHFAKAYALDA